jgi:hypothetical protein
MRRETSDQLDGMIAKAKDFLNFACVKVAGLPSKDLRIRIAKRFFSIASQHFGAMTILIENGDFDSSALSLQRSLIEAHSKGMWVLTRATENDLTQIQRRDFDFSQPICAYETRRLPDDLREILLDLDYGGRPRAEFQGDEEGPVVINLQSTELVVTLSANDMATLAEALCSCCHQSDHGKEIAKRFTNAFFT